MAFLFSENETKVLDCCIKLYGCKVESFIPSGIRWQFNFVLFAFFWVYVYFNISRYVNMSINFFISRIFLCLEDFKFDISSLIFSND